MSQQSQQPIQQHPATSWPELKAKQLQRLENLGIPLDRYNLFLETFVPHRWDWTASSLAGHWYGILKRPLVHSDIINHLEGRRFVGARAARVNGRPVTRFVVFDIDVHEADPHFRRLEILRDAFGPPLLFRSSASNGRHAYYFLPEHVPIDRLYDGRNRPSDGLLWRALCELGLEPKQGWLELYPAGCTFEKPSGRYRCGNALRLPFGNGSALLSPKDFTTQIAKDPLTAFHIVIQGLEEGSLPMITVDQMAKLAQPNRASEPVAPEEQPAGTATGFGEDKSRRKRSRGALRAAAVSLGESALEGEFKHGLTGPGQTNAALLAASKQLARVCTSREELFDNVLAWFSSHHDGHSGTLHRGGWPAVEKQAKDAVEWAWERRSLGAVPTLTPREIHRIRALAEWATTRPLMPVPATLRFKLEFLMSELTQRAKQWVLWRVIEMRVALLTADPALHDDADKLADRLAEEIQNTWPGSAGQVFSVAMPWKLRARLPGISLRTMTFLFQELKYMGFVRLRKNYCTTTGTAAQYDVELDFSAPTPISTSPLPWEALLMLAVPASVTREERSRHTSKRITGEGTAALRERFGITEHALATLMQAGSCWTCAQEALANSEDTAAEADATEAPAALEEAV